MSDLPWQEQAALEDLRFYWAELYSITHYPGGPWTALWRKGIVPPLMCGSADGLRQRIEADYAEREPE